MTTRTTPRIYVDITPFENAHGRAPRGRGSWAFQMGWHPRGVAPAPVNLFWHNGTYAEAKRAALAEARRVGVDTVCVCS